MKPILSAADIAALADRGLPTCFAQADPRLLAMQSAGLPLVVGVDARNQRLIEIFYTCSDVCPQYGGVWLRYQGIEDTNACCAAGGEPIIDPAFRAYRGCAPPEAASHVAFNYPKPDGSMGQATRSACHPDEIRFVDDPEGKWVPDLFLLDARKRAKEEQEKRH